MLIDVFLERTSMMGDRITFEPQIMGGRGCIRGKLSGI